MLVAHPQQLDDRARSGADEARKLVAEQLPPGLRRLGPRARSESARFLRNLRSPARGFEDRDGQRMNVALSLRERKTDVPLRKLFPRWRGPLSSRGARGLRRTHLAEHLF